MADLIERQAITDALIKEYPLLKKPRLMKTINSVPPAEQRTGHWDKDGKCDQCGKYPPFCHRSEYCPHCGAKMEGNNE